MPRILNKFSRGRYQGYLLFLLVPGISLKRWVAVGCMGLASITLGVIFALEISTGPSFISFLEIASLRNESSFLRGAVFIGIGVAAALIAVTGLFRSFRPIRQRSRHLTMLDSLYLEKGLGSGPNVTVIGGGSGLPNLLTGLKHYT